MRWPQEIFLTAFESIPGFRVHSSIKTWLYGIAFKKCLEVERNRKRREALVWNHQETIGARVHCDPPGQPVARLGCRDTPTPPQAATPWHRNGKVVWSGARDESRLVGGLDGSSGSHHSNGAGVAYCLAAAPRPRWPTTEAAMRFDHHGWPGRVETQEAMALQAREELERTLFVPAPVPRLTGQKERHSHGHRHTHRAGHPRGAPGKATHPHKRPATGQQAPG